MHSLRTKIILTGVLAMLLVLVTALPLARASSDARRRSDDVSWVREARQAHQPARALGLPMKARMLALVVVLIALLTATSWVRVLDWIGRAHSGRHLRWSARSRRGPPAFA